MTQLKIDLNNCRLRYSRKDSWLDEKDLYLALILDSLERLQDKKTTKQMYQREIAWLFNDESGEVSLKLACENTNISIKLVRKLAVAAIKGVYS